MIVYTATDEVNGKVYVGSTREDLEEHWITLVNQAEDGAEGEFFAAIRHQGADKFEIEEFGYADSSSEARALIREAQEELGAVAVKAGRGSVAVSKAASRAKMLSSSAKLDQAASLISENGSESVAAEPDLLVTDDLVTDIVAGKNSCVAPQNDASQALSIQATPSATGSPENTVVKAGQLKAEASKIAVNKKKTSLDLVKQALAEAAVDVSQGSADVKASRVPVKKSSSEKLATGRTGSVSKEQRIKETIQREREAREPFRQTGSTQEAAKMKDLMMGIEARRLAARKTSKDARLAEARKKAAADRKAKVIKKAVEANRVESMKRILNQGSASDSSAGDVDLPAKKVTSKKDSRAQAKLLAANILSARTE